MKFPHNSKSEFRKDSGAAIIIVLAFVVMLTFVVMAFFSRATVNSQIENSRTGGAKAGMLARGAAELIVADLKKEMLLSSGSTTVGSAPNTSLVLTPVKDNNGNYTSMVPMRVLMNSVTSDPNFNNLVKQSGILSVGGLIPAGTVSTAAPSMDGHKISGARWSAPQLTGGSNGPVDFSDSQVPNWTLVTRSGVPASQAWDPSFKNALTSNSNHVIGRFAFNVYDEGGLLDVNVAGFPTSVVSGSDASLKGSQGVVDLSLIPGVTNANTFVKSWRNLATGQTSADYLGYLGLGSSNSLSSGVLFGEGPKYGFLRSGTSSNANDNRLLGRQDLIRLASNGTLGITSAALPFLSTFTRSLNAPSYTPDPKRPRVIDPQMASKGLDDAFNPGMLSGSARVTGTFARPDGTVAQIGEPLLKHRFPLSRLTLISATATCTSTVNDPVNNPIYTFFGLTRASTTDPWVYYHNTAGVKNMILKMNQVQSQGREPDFFELLLASINVGSLGKGWRPYDQNYYYQIIQIGANLINQANPDSYPRRISFNSGAVEIDGVTNLPYLSRVLTKCDRDQPLYTGNTPTLGPPPGSLIGPLGVWFQAEIWNPHQNASTPAASGPTEFRFWATGSVYFDYYYLTITGTTPSYTYNNVGPVDAPLFIFPAGSDSSGIHFTLSSVSDHFATPTLLTPANATATDPHDNTKDIAIPWGGGNNPFIGLYTASAPQVPVYFWSQKDYYYPGSNPYPAPPPPPPNQSYSESVEVKSDVTNPLTFLLQYKDPRGNWITYTSIPDTISQGAGNGGTDFNGNTFRVYKADPRSLRFGYSAACDDSSDVVQSGSTWHNTLRSYYDQPGWPGSDYNWGGTSIGFDTQLHGPSANSYTGFVGDYYGYFAENITKDRGYTTQGDKIGPNYYADPDGVIRPGNADRDYGTTADGEELQIPAAVNRSRPIILNRPFRSVAEMGYAFRDDPFKTLDFFSKESADAALLDTFCVDEQSGSALTAGVLNLNTRQQPVLKAVVNGVLKDQASNLTLSEADGESIATLIANTTSASPLQNRSELATRISPLLAYGSATDGAIKARRESVLRALADTGDTRTWNLLIDVIAQSGRFPLSANASDQFVVEGECRCWLHVAIDRFTGQVIDQSLEVVNE